MPRTAKMVACPKCAGTGFLPCYAGIANGVCFRCAGSKVVKASTVKPPKPMNEYEATLAAVVLDTPADGFAGMTYRELSNLRDFAHYPQATVPNLLAVWREKGEPHFMAAQERRLEAFYASR